MGKGRGYGKWEWGRGIEVGRVWKVGGCGVWKERKGGGMRVGRGRGMKGKGGWKGRWEKGGGKEGRKGGGE